MSKKKFKRFLMIVFISGLSFSAINSILIDSSLLKGQINDPSVFNEIKHGLKSSETWIPDDAVICNATNDQNYLQLCSDGAGGIICVWEDERKGSDTDIYAQRVNSTGDVQWTSNGIAICTESYIQYDPQICSDGLGGAIIAWTDLRDETSYSDIYAQRINSNGNILWNVNGILICNANESQHYPWICSDEMGGAYITWMDSRSDFFADVYAQRVNSSGDVQWIVDGIAICTANEFQWSPQIISDCSGGAIIVWKDERNGGLDLYGQRVSPNGTILWTTNGKAICTQGHYQRTFIMCSDNQGGVFLAWQNWWDILGRYGIYSQWVNSSGDIQWAHNGETICYFTDFDGNRGIPEICIDSNGDPVIAWEDTRGWNPPNIYAQKINSTGNTQWTNNGTAVVSEVTTQTSVKICSDYNGGVILVWADSRNENGDIYAQRLNSAGDGVWALNGVPVCMANESQFNPEIYEDGFGGAIVAWLDDRNGIDYDIYAQRINSTGDIQWMTKEVSNGGENGEKPYISYGNYYLIIVIISILSLAYIKKKQKSSKKNIN
ncbi:MAG: hypothetical protein ACFFCI_11370 [Promethearchaeota archaeon]